MAKPFVDITLTGDKALDKKLAAFTPKVQKKQISNATKAVAQGVAKGAQALAPMEQDYSRENIKPGTLKRSIKVRTLKRSRVKQGHIVITLRKAFGGMDAIYPSFVEFGSQEQEAQPFMRRSLKSQETAAISKFRKELQRAISEHSVTG